MSLRKFHFGETGAGELGGGELAGGARAGLEAAVDRHAVEGGGRAAHLDAVGHTVVGEIHGDAGHEAREFGDAEVGQVAVGIQRDDVLHVAGVALGGEGGGGALAVGTDLELAEPVNGAGEIEVTRGRGAGRDAEGDRLRIEAGVGGDDDVLAGGQSAEGVVAAVVGTRGQSERGHLDRGAAQQVAGRLIANPAGD